MHPSADTPTTARQLRLLEGIASTTRDFFYAFNLDHRFIYANDRLLEVWGVSREQALGKSLLELGYPQWHADMHHRELEQVIATKQPIRGEVPFTGGSGISGVYEYIFSPVFDAAGNIEFIAGTTRDVTDRKRAEQDREVLAEQRRLALDSASLGWWHLDPVSGDVIWDERFREIFGVTAGRLEYAKVIELLHPEDRARVNAAIQAAIRPENSQPYDIEYRVVHPDGSLHWIRASGKAYHAGEGPNRRYTSFVGTIADITAARAAREALEQSESQFRQLADAMPQIVWAARPDGVLDYYNRRWFEYIDLPESAGDQAVWDRYIHPNELPVTVERWTASVRAGTPYSTEFRVRRADGQYRWFLARALPVYNAAGELVRWFGTCTDIHDHKELQQQNAQLLDSERAARGEAERTSRMKDDFLATLSHELRTPLNAIVGWSQILRAAPPSPEDLAEGLEIIDRNARAQATIIEDLLDMSRIMAGKVRLDVQRLNLSSVIEAALGTVRPAADAKSVRLHSVLDPQIDAVSGDPNRLQQVFWNLLSNAIKFTPKGGRVQVLLERINSHVEVTISDTGIGISADFLPHVFDRFRQADATTTRRHGGLGLGLSIVKQLVELHGGTVTVKSGGENQGTTFTVALPLLIVHHHSHAEAAPSHRRHPAAGLSEDALDHSRDRLRGVNILIVDDEPDARALLRRLLQDCDATVTSAASAKEAFEFFTKNRPDVLISDIGMPDEDGYSFIRRIRALPTEQGGAVPALALTAYARTEDRVKSVLAGFQLHLTKPVEPTEFITMIASLLGRSSAG